MKRLLKLVLLVFLLGNTFVRAQDCLHTSLSYKFNYKLAVKKTVYVDTFIESPRVRNVVVHLKIYDKSDKKIHQALNIKLPDLHLDSFNNCDSVRSYITGYSKNKEVDDYDFGDFIVADLNFDGKEDFAIKCHYTVDGGPDYMFYIQDSVGNFRLNNFLTTHMGGFPKYFDAKRKTLTTQLHANVSQEAKKTFQYNSKTQKWKLIKWVMVDD